jgi:hypothetical protein
VGVSSNTRVCLIIKHNTALEGQDTTKVAVVCVNLTCGLGE